MPPTDLLLIRHAQSSWNARGLWQGHADPPLSAFGMQQAEWLARHLASVDITRIVSSDLLRARATAEAVATIADAPLTCDHDLREIDVGSWSGRTRADIASTEPDAFARYEVGGEGWSGGERFADLDARSARAMQRVATADDSGTVAVVTHGVALRSQLVALLQLAPEHRRRFGGLRHASVTHVQRSSNGWRLVQFNVEPA